MPKPNTLPVNHDGKWLLPLQDSGFAITPAGMVFLAMILVLALLGVFAVGFYS